jgi:hypothetical protein
MLPIVLVLEKPNYSDDIRAEEGKADWMIDKPSLIPLRKNCSSSADNPGLSLGGFVTRARPVGSVSRNAVS